MLDGVGVGVGGGLGRLCRRQRKSGLHGTQGESRGSAKWVEAFNLKVNEIHGFISWINNGSFKKKCIVI